MNDPDLHALGNCRAGQEACVAGHWGACSVQPAAKDGCTIGDDATCNGRPNEGCACVDGATQPCGPAAETGICKRGTQTCTGAAWGACVGAVTTQPRDCTSSADNDCNGTADNLDASCACPANTTGACPGNNTGPCKSGTRTCVLATNKGSTSWSTTCTGAVLPAAADTCDSGNDANCNGMPNEGCQCINGSPPKACACGTQSCSNGKLGACVVSCSGSTPVCLNSTCVGCTSDANCTGARPSCDLSTHTCVCRRKSVANILPTPGFDTMAQTVGIWIDADTILGTVWSDARLAPGSDADGCPESGSVFGTVQATSPCVAVTPGGLYHFGLKYKNATAADPGENCQIIAYSDAGCPFSGGFSQMSPSLILQPSTAWKSASISWTIPPTLNQARVTCNYGISGGPGSGVNSYIDQLYLNASADSF